MLEAEDIKKLTEYQLNAYKEVFLTKDDFKGLGTKVNKIEADVSVLKADVSVLKADVSTLKTDVFVLKEDATEMKSTMQTLGIKIDKVQNSVDGLVKLYKDDNQEITVLNGRMKNAEDFLDTAAPKLGLEFKH